MPRFTARKNRRRAFAITCSFVGLLSVGSAETCAQDEEAVGGITSQEMSERSQQLGGSPAMMGREGELLWRRAVETGDCDSLSMAAFLIMVSANRLGESRIPERVLQLESKHPCVISTSALAYSIGVHAALNGNWGQAEPWFQRTVVLAENEPMVYLQNALNALAVAQMNLGEHRRAIATLKRLHQLDRTAFPIESMNTLAYANFLVGNCSDALEWCALGANRIAEISKESGMLPSVYESALVGILLTELEISIALDDKDRAASAFDRINFDGSFDQREINAAAALVLYFQWSELPDLAVVMRNRLQRWAEGVDSHGLEDHLGVNSTLFRELKDAPDSLWQAELMRLADLPFELRGLVRSECGRSMEPAGLVQVEEGRRRWEGYAIVSGLVLLAVFGGVAWAGFHFRRRARLRLKGDAELVSFLDSATERQRRAWFRKDWAAFDAYSELLNRHFPQLEVGLQALMSDWPEVECEVALALAQGQTSKSIAIEQDLTMGRIYTIRRVIRKRLGLKSHVDLDDWLQSHMKS